MTRFAPGVGPAHARDVPPDEPGTPRLLLVVDSLDEGGAERHVTDLALALARRGHDVAVACSVAGPLGDSLAAGGVTVHELTGRLVKRRLSLDLARGLRRLVRGGAFDLVHAHLYASASAAAVATVGTGVPLVVTEHSEGSWMKRRHRWTTRLAYRGAAAVAAVSNPIRERLVERDRVPPARVSHVPNAVLPPPPRPPQLVRRNGDGPVVARVARLHPEKGVDVFIEAAARVAPVRPDARFLVVGDGPLRRELRELAGRHGLDGRLEFIGHRAEARHLIGDVDVLAISSRSEGSPLVSLEAMAAGVPVVATAVGGLPEQIRHGESGLLVPPEDADALAQALVELLDDPARRRRLAEAGRRRVASDLSYPRMLARILRVYALALDPDAARRDDADAAPFADAPADALGAAATPD